MNLLRRPEVGALLALVLAGLAWVAVSQRQKHAGTDDGTAGDAAPGMREVRVTRAESISDGTHRRLRVEFTARHDAANSIDVHPPAVRLLDASGGEVPVFFAPGAFSPALPPGAPAASWIEFWLTESQAGGPLTLEVAGRRAPVPSVQPGTTGG